MRSGVKMTLTVVLVLRSLLLTEKKKIPDGEHISREVHFTDAVVIKIKNYYGLAIHQNYNKSVDDMIKFVWESYFHWLSTHDDPQHDLWPTGQESWCGFNKGKETDSHYVHIHYKKLVLPEVKPVFRSSDMKHLEKCFNR